MTCKLTAQGGQEVRFTEQDWTFCETHNVYFQGEECPVDHYFSLGYDTAYQEGLVRGRDIALAKIVESIKDAPK